VRTVTWGGNPEKPVIVGDNPLDLSPRRSFAQWHQLVERTAEPWTPADLAAARLIGETVADVVLQFRSVRMLIAQDQVESIGRQIRRSDHPVLIADPGGRILLTNEAFERLWRTVHRHIDRLGDLPGFFTEPAEVRRSLDDLLRSRRSWRGEVALEDGLGESRPLLVRADAVLAAPDRVLGFVLLFTDLTERKAAELARRRFQDGILEERITAGRLNSKADLLYRSLLASIVGNAQLAALEITDGVDVARMPELLRSVRASLNRTAELLEDLIGHASRTSERER
jgi:PAS domain-containing protein